jgi:integrase
LLVKFHQQRLGQVAEGRFVGSRADRVRFEELVEGLLHDYQANSRKSLDEAERRIRLHLAPFFTLKRAHQITTADVKAFIAHRREEGASNGEINRELACLKRMFNLGLEADKITRKPIIRLLEENNARQGFFERAEFESVLARLPDWLRPAAMFAYQTGWRPRSEILPLTWNQVDLDAGTVRLEVGTTKNKGGRLVYLPVILRDVLESQWGEHLAHYPECPFVFHRNGKRVKKANRSWNRACQEAGLVGKIPHDFRRTAVRNMVRAGIPERVAMQIAGHKTRSVFDRYHIVSDGDLREAAQKLDQSVAGTDRHNFRHNHPQGQERAPLSS